jgi:DNA-3-methyladenine glycosylase II
MTLNVIEPVAPFRLALTAWALRRRAHNAIDRFDGRTYRRALHIDNTTVALSVTQSGSPDTPRLAARLSGAVYDEDNETIARNALDDLLGLSINLSGFASLAAGDAPLARLAYQLRGLKPTRFPTVFEALINAIACQQLSLTVGIHLLNRLTANHGRRVPGDPDGLHAFPTPQDLAPMPPEQLRAIGFSTTKARTIVDSAAAIVDGTLNLDSLHDLDDQTAVSLLTSRRGVGRWSAEYVLLRGLGRLNVFPADDIGARNNLNRLLNLDGPLDYESTADLVARWHPYAGVVYFHMLLASLSKAGTLAVGGTA